MKCKLSRELGKRCVVLIQAGLQLSEFRSMLKVAMPPRYVAH